MIKEAIDRILGLATPTIHTVGPLEYTDKKLDLIYPPGANAVECSTLQGLVDLFTEDLDAVKPDEVLVHITSPTTVELISKDSDEHGRRRVWAEANYPVLCKPFPFGSWLNPEAFLIGLQAQFQRVKIESNDGEFALDLDYVMKAAAGISAGTIQTSTDDGISQTVEMKAGIVLKNQQTLKPIVNLAPYRTFTEIDQVVSGFVFRARQQGERIELALFEADGGRWSLNAVAAIKAWLAPKFDAVPIIS